MVLVIEVSRKTSECKGKTADAFLETLVGTWTCQRPGGTGELESVDHGWSRDSRSLSRRRGQIFSMSANDWLFTEFAGTSAGSTRVPGSSSPFLFSGGR